MIEAIKINGQTIWIAIDRIVYQQAGGDAEEYFTASYHVTEPNCGNTGGILIEENKSPKQFKSPVEAIEYASEYLLGIK